MRRPRLRLRVKGKFTFIAAAFASAVIVYFILTVSITAPTQVKAGTETIRSGSFIVDMGVIPQSYNNALKPYGMIYDLITNYSVPVKWIIEPSKVKDGADFTYSSTAYKGGPFIIPVEYITSTVASRITYWKSQGVVGVYTTSPINVPVYCTLTNFPKSIIDDASNNSAIITDYYDNAMIPSAAYTIGMASSLTNCSDLWINPHGDPDWDTHGYLYNLATSLHSYIWCQCHAVSVMEGVRNPNPPNERLNFLTTTGLKCYSNGKCGTPNETHGNNSSSPYTYSYPSDPIMQFMGTMNGASNNGSERWYQPLSAGAWRGTSKLLVTTADGSGSNSGVLMVYGPAYGNPANGYVMYTGGHSLENGTTAEKIAAQRSFLNFVLLTGKAKQLNFTEFSTPATVYSQQTVTVSASVTSGNAPYNYQWSSTIGGSFANANSATTTFTAPYTSSNLTGNLICTVTDACARKNFASNPVNIPASTLAVSLKSFSGFYSDKKVTLSWVTSSEINNEFFEVLKSTDGIHFTPLGTEKGNGNSTIQIGYNFVDRDIPDNCDVLYYQLKQFDFDGKETVFDAIAIELNNEKLGVFEVMPNPFTDKIKIDYYTADAQTVSVTLINNAGKIIFTNSFKCPRGFTPIELDNLEGLPAGIYFIAVNDDRKQRLTRIIKL